MRNHNSDYYREEAERYKKLAQAATDPAKKQEFLELADACEDVADSIVRMVAPRYYEVYPTPLNGLFLSNPGQINRR